jgi:hypothetical protein
VDCFALSSCRTPCTPLNEVDLQGGDRLGQ